MSKSRFILKQIHVKGSSLNSDLTRYVAKSKIDEEREGKVARLLFSEHDDNLTHTQARKFLSITGGGELRRDETLHYVLSFRDEKDFELLQSNEEERRDKIASILRESISKALDSIGIFRMRWVAGIHRNTDNPHVHILFNKNAIEKATLELIQIKRLPSSLVAHHLVLEDGRREFSYGEIINSFAEKIDTQMRERKQLHNLEITYSKDPVLEHETLSKDLSNELVKDKSHISIEGTKNEKERNMNEMKEQEKERTLSSQTHIHLL